MSSRAKRLGLLVGVDGSAPSDAAVLWGARAAAQRNVPLTLVHARKAGAMGSQLVPLVPAPVPVEFVQWQEEQGEQVLAQSVKIAESIDPLHRPEVHPELIFSAPVPTLVDLSKDADMVVVGRRGQGVWQRTLLFGQQRTGAPRLLPCRGDSRRGSGTLWVAGAAWGRRFAGLGASDRHRIRGSVVAENRFGGAACMERRRSIEYPQSGVVGTGEPRR